MKSSRMKSSHRNTYRRRLAKRTTRRNRKRTNRRRSKQRGGAMRPKDPIPFSAVVEHRPLEDEMTGVARMVPYETFLQMKENDELT